jgi:uncharacterized protein (DUF1800 family)
MALSRDAATQTLIAFQRFGLGAKPGGAALIGADPKGALRAEILTRGIAEIRDRKLLSYEEACARSQMDFSNDVYVAEMIARFKKHLSVDIGFAERLVVFWSNHFAMNAKKANVVRGTIGQWERDVIRPNLFGKFGDMLHGTMKHPAMIAYLDNVESIGPKSETGLRFHVGYNENLARELMELHTLGSDSGYTEQDVTSLALILTGWSYVRGIESDAHRNGGTSRNRGQFIYRDYWHEPGAISLMGKAYPPGRKGSQAELVLDDLAAHPATAEHIAIKLVRHFITDEPTPAMVEPLKQKFLNTGGDLKAVSLALLELPEAWSTPLDRVRTPYEMLIAQFRALEAPVTENQFLPLMTAIESLHQTQWQSPSPAGYSDNSQTWLNPDGMRVRLDVVQRFGRVLAGGYAGDVSRLAKSLFGAALSRQTAERIDGIGDNNNALTILFGSPEFQRR